MNISSAEKKKALVLIIIWLVVGVVGFVFFWTTSPVREIRAVMSNKDAVRLDEGTIIIGQQIADVVDGKPVGEVPTMIGDTPVSQKVRDDWDAIINDGARQLSLAIEAEYEKYEPSMLTSIEYSQTNYNNHPTITLQRSTESLILDTCGDWRFTLEPTESSTDDYNSSRYNCATVRVDVDSKEIVGIELQRF